MKTRAVNSPARAHPELVYVYGCGPRSDVMFIGEAPGAEEEYAARDGKDECIMVGATGNEMDKLVRRATNDNVSLRDCYRTNIEKHRPPFNDLKKMSELGVQLFQYMPQVWEEIIAIKPKVLVAVGGHALQALTGKKGIMKWRGSILENNFCKLPKVIPILHPAGLLHKAKKGMKLSYKASHWIVHDLKRAFEESAYPDLRLPVRNLEVCESAEQLRRFLRRYSDRRIWSLDTESIRGIPTCLGLAADKSHALSVPLFRVDDSVLLPDDEYSEVWEILGQFLDDPTIQILGQNWKHDQPKLTTICGFRIRAQLWMDTAMAAHWLYPEFPKKLEFLTSIYTREPYYKDELKEFDPRTERYIKVLVYNAKDVAIPFEIGVEKFLPELKERGLWDSYQEFVIPLHYFYLDLESTGMMPDHHKRIELWRKYSEYQKRIEEELDEIAGRHININSSVKDIPWLMDHVGLPPRQSYDEDNLISLLGNHAKNYAQKRALELVVTGRKVKRMKSAYLAAKPDYDNRFRTSVNINGTETGRTSDTILSNKGHRPHPIGLPFKTLSKHGEFGPELREAFLPDPGYEFLECDQSQAEARVVAHLSDDLELLALFDTTDVHKMTAGWFFYKEPADVTEDERFIGKQGRHMGNLGAGKHRVMLTINTEARRFGIRKKNADGTPGDIVTVSEKEAGSFVEIFHAKSPRIRGVYHPTVLKALRDNRMILTCPSGRQRLFTDRWDQSLEREAFSTIPQGTVTDQTKQAGLWIMGWNGKPGEAIRRGLDVRMVIESHDALVALTRPEQRVEVAQMFREAFEKPIDFSGCSIKKEPLRIPCEIKIGKKNLREMEKYKWPSAA